MPLLFTSNIARIACFSPKKTAVEFTRIHAIEDLVRILVRGCEVAGDAGIEEGDIEPAEAVKRRVHESRIGCLLGHVGGQRTAGASD